MRPTRRTMAAAALATLGAAAAIAVTAARHNPTHHDAKTTQEALATFTDQGVTVTITTRNQTSNSATLEVTFTPGRPGFHLYSADLPPDGIDGIGRPLTVTTSGALKTTGRLTTNVPTHQLTLQGADITVPVYPDGPVTADLPVTVTATGPATLTVGYAACSQTQCLPPVTAHMISLQATGLTISIPKTAR